MSTEQSDRFARDMEHNRSVIQDSLSPAHYKMIMGAIKPDIREREVAKGLATLMAVSEIIAELPEWHSSTLKDYRANYYLCAAAEIILEDSEVEP